MAKFKVDDILTYCRNSCKYRVLYIDAGGFWATLEGDSKTLAYYSNKWDDYELAPHEWKVGDFFHLNKIGEIWGGQILAEHAGFFWVKFNGRYLSVEKSWLNNKTPGVM